MSQTRTFLIFAWLMVAALLWMEWNKEQIPAATPAPVVALQNGVTPAGALPPASGVPGADTTIPGAAAPTVSPGAPVPSATAVGPAPAPGMSATTAPPAADRVVVSTDVLRLTLDGGNVFDAELLRYPQSKADGAAPVKLLNDDPASYYVAQSGWVGQDGAQAPTHLGGFLPEHPERSYVLAPGQKELSVPFIWRSPDGVTIRRTYTFTPGSYTMSVRDEVANAGSKPWQGFIYRQLARTPPASKSGLTNPEAYSFAGATWFGAEHGYERRKYADFVDDGPLDRTIKGGWAAMLQHHFFTAWIPQVDQQARFDVGRTGAVDRINISGPSFTVAPGQQASSTARLWVGPKLVDQIQAQAVPGLDRAVDYSRFSMFALLGQGLFWVLSKLHGFIGNWGWSIIAMVVLLKIVLFPLSAAQYKSAARMRRFQPRIAQLKERYGDDKQKFQAAMMELYKKEKINPIGGCLPVLPQMIIFMALYWVLMESVELRQAPWIGWIQDLTARDPYFILPVVNMAIMYTTQKLQPAIGMDPMQQKMMQFMPLAFGVLLAFLPAGLVLYQVANGGLGLLQQWLATKKYADPPPGAPNALVDSKA